MFDINRVKASVAELIQSLNARRFRLEVQDELPTDTVYVATTDNLPLDGEADITYHVVADGSVWRWTDGAYHEVNPYVYGVDQQYRDHARVIRPKSTIVDPTATMASLSLEQVRGGSSEVLATLYNLYALRADLGMFERIVVNGHKMTVMDLLGKGRHLKAIDNVTEWFQREHKAMWTLLNSCIQHRDGRIWAHNPVIDALYKQKALLVWDDVKKRAMLRLENFEVYL
jgi:hypothetical protein